MKYRIAIAMACAAIAGSAVHAQRAYERVEGNQRICTFEGSLSGQYRELRVGLGQNCPGTYPNVDTRMPTPPYASLTGQRMVNGQRICVYGGAWSFALPPEADCPLAAGMLPREQLNRR